MIYSNLPPYIRIQLYQKLLEQELGYDKAHELIEQTELEYAVLSNCSNIEIR